MARIAIVTILLLVLAAISVEAETPSGGDILVFLPFDQVPAALKSIPSGLRASQRVPEGYLLRSSPATLRRLLRAGVPIEVLDRGHGEGEHALVSTPPRRTVQLPPVGTTLRLWADHRLMRGNESTWAALRGAGAMVVPLEDADLPIDDVRLHLSSSLATRYDSSIASMIALVSDTTVREVIQGLQDFGTRHWGNANRDSVGRWIRARFHSYGVTDVQLDSFQQSSTWQVNVVGTLPGSDTQEGELIVGGHHDSYSSNQSQAPGADDNATGTAAALEMARVLRLVNYQPNLTMRFLTFGAEEAGLIGSASYALRARNAGRNIKSMQNYDMIGNRNTAQTDRDVYVVWYTGSEAFSNLHAAMLRMYTTVTPVFTSSYRSGSDSYSFWNRNYNAVFCIERDFSPYYHSPNDLLQYLDMAYARDIIRGGLAMLLQLDKAPPAVEGLVVRDQGSGTSVVVSWDSVEVPDLYRYRVHLGTMPGVYTQSYQQTERTRTLTGLTAGTPYYVGVSMVDLAGVEGMILERSITPSAVPAPPIGLTVDADSAGSLLTWRANREVDILGYHVYHAVGTSAFARMTTSPHPDTAWSTSTPGGFYYVTAVDLSGNESAPSDTVEATVSGVGEEPVLRPGAFRILGAYPNPFNPATSISFEVGMPGHVTVAVHDLLGRRVETLLDERMEAGSHTIRWDAQGATSGVYYVVLRSGQGQAVRSVMLLR